jgi:5-hydroxyisourate hydrolase-like protein (transthyretin family)
MFVVGAVGIAALAASMLSATPAMAAGELTGVVTSSGAPASDVQVYLYKLDTSGTPYWSGYDNYYTSTDGTYSFNLPTDDGSYALYYYTEDSSALYSSSRSWDDKSDTNKMAPEFTVTGGVASQVSFPKALPIDTGAISATFVDSSTGAPIAFDPATDYTDSYYSVSSGYTEDGYVNDGPDPLESNTNGYANNTPVVVTGQVAAGAYYNTNSQVYSNLGNWYNYTPNAPVSVTVGATTSVTVPVYKSSLPNVNELLNGAQTTVSGVPKVGALLTAVTPTVAGVSYSGFQWYNAASPIVGATSATYIPTTKDLGQQLYVNYVANAAGYAPNSYGSAYGTKKVALGDPNSGTVAITGTAAFGKTVTATVSTALAGRNSYQWYLNGAPIAGEDGSSYTIPASALGGSLTVGVGSTVQGHTDATIPSAAVVIAKDTVTLKATVAKKATTKTKLKVKVALTEGKSDLSATAKVKVYYTKTKFKSVTVKSNKTATVTLPKLKKGTTTIKIVYPGTSKYAAKTVTAKVKVTAAK